MKKIFFILILSAGFIACKQSVKGTNGVTYKNPVQYNDFIVGRQTELMKKIVAFSEVAQTNPDSAFGMLKTYARETDVMIKEMKGMPPYGGDSSLRDAAIHSFTFYKKIFEDDYRRILEITKSGENQTEEGAAKANEIVEKLAREEEQFDKDFHNAQESFARKNNMKLTENSMQKKIDDLDK